MAKGKSAGGVPNRPLYSRLSFLYQAAALLAAPRQHGMSTSDQQKDSNEDAHEQRQDQGHQFQGMSRRLLSDLRAVSLKAQLPVIANMKRTICKFCNTFLVEGETAVSTVENKSKGGRKPWADILVVKCNTCGREKRFPVSAPRQKRKTDRAKVGGQEPIKEQNT